MSTAPASPPVLSTAPAPGSTDPPGLQDIWNSEIDLAIMQFLYQAKTQRNGTHDTFLAAVWTSLGKHLMENGHRLCTNEDLKDRFCVLKQRGYLLSPTGVIVPAAPSPAAPAATVPDRAQWTSEAEAISIEFFIAKKAQGLMSENNFKGKVYNLAAEHLCAKGHSFSGKQVKACWTRFKAEFKIVAKLHTLSGFGWDNARSMVIATDQVWDAYLVGHPKARPFLAAQKAPDTSLSSDDDDEDSDSDAADSEKESPVKKRRAAGPTPAPKRVRTSAGAQALTSMSSTFAVLTEGLKSGEFLTSPSTDSPVKKKKAFDIVRAEEGLSPHSLAKARRVFCGSGEVAREYLSFDSTKDEERSARTFWLMDEMDRV
ncbi:hypothetical protein D9758_018536 [Tetrapyrgos nigripes]|uniref:Myb/SANT-like domain-containing protein n=1 Tax=Tetrapyrgos nigripes TaxID=182062 RepID=A0A8H5AYU5_9AGAR|nr:hypothetical protein D9758_018536 [Tetrapyrgos nigripes]